ncbi:MAG: hypothetical protein HYY93_09770 [Planctomycetes bacterium]|nr:hypothetical protein [Planctomycetota bacterium]
MKRLHFLYDPRSAFCQRCRVWLARQSAYVKIDPWPAPSPETQRRFPGAMEGRADEMVVVDENGGIYRGPHVAVMCLYALRRYRPWARRMARPENLPFALHGFGLLVTGTVDLSKWFGPEATRARRTAAASAPVPWAQLAERSP